MNTKEHKAYIKEIQAYTEKVLRSEEDTRAFFRAAGIHTKSGKLTSNYTDGSTGKAIKASAK